MLVPLVAETLGRQGLRENRRCASLAGKQKCTTCFSTTRVLSTDGGVVDKEEWLSRILRQATAEKAKDLAEYILNRAKNNCGGAIPDDMTVVVLKVLDKAISIPLAS